MESSLFAGSFMLILGQCGVRTQVAGIGFCGIMCVTDIVGAAKNL